MYTLLLKMPENIEAKLIISEYVAKNISYSVKHNHFRHLWTNGKNDRITRHKTWEQKIVRLNAVLPKCLNERRYYKNLF